jgi:hypothetical protein
MPESEQGLWHKMDARIDQMGERIARLEVKVEEKSQRTFQKLISDYGGIVALVLSITIGLFTLYDKLVVGPKAQRLQAETALRNDINELAGIGARIAGLDWTKYDVASAQAQMLTPQRLALLERISNAGKRMPSVVQFADHMLLISEYEYFGRFPEAMDQAERAMEIAHGANERGNAYWARARIDARLSNLERMRSDFRTGVTVFKSLGLRDMASQIMPLYTQWIYLELVNGSCDTARAAYQAMAADYAHPDVWENTRAYTRDQFAKMLGQAPRTCGLHLP